MSPAKKTTLSIMLAAFAVAVVRSPFLLLHGRVYGEEGNVYFKQAWESRPMDALFALHQGYYSLFMNGLTLLIEKCLPLEALAVSLTWSSLLILMLSVYLAATCEAFSDERSRWIAAGVVVFTPAIDAWMIAEDVQFYLAACVALICLSDEGRNRLVRSLTLALAGLTGPCSAAFAPFFIWRAYRRRTAWAAAQAAILSFGTLLEGVTIVHSLRMGARTLNTSDKAVWFGPVLFMKVFAVTFFGRLGAFLCQRLVTRHGSLAVCLLLWALALTSLLIFWKTAKRGGGPGRVCFAMATISLVFNYVGVYEPLSVLYIGAFRYVFTGFMLLWLVPVLAYARAQRDGDRTGLKLARAFVVMILTWGIVDSAGYWTRFQNLGPDWKAQVAAWRRDPNRQIRVAPAEQAQIMYLRPH